MGTDISMYAEIKRNGRWHFLGDMEENKDYFPEENPNAQRHKPIEIYDSRNYPLFAILADMRNPDKGVTYDVIAQPRGLPQDLSPEIQNWLLDWEVEDQTDFMVFSWLLLSEVLDFNWQKKVQVKEGAAFNWSYAYIVGKHALQKFEELKQYGEPSDIRLVFWFDS